MKKFFTLLLLICLQTLISQPSIQTPTIVPIAPTIFYPVKILTAYGTGNKSYKINKSFMLNTTQKTITLEACFWQSTATQASLQKDTFNVGQLPAGIYTVTFTAIGSFSSSVCVQNINASKTFTFEIFDDAVSVPRESIGPSVSVYPNPVKDLLHVEVPSATAETSLLSLYNSFGEVILKDQCVIPDQAIDLSRLINGVYFLEIKSASVPKYMKVIKE